MYILFLSILKIKSLISDEELIDYFEDMTLDRVRQIYWDIVCDVNEKSSPSEIGEELQKKYAEDLLHSSTRNDIIRSLSYSLQELTDFDYYLDIDKFKSKLDEIDLFNFANYDNLISVKTPKNFLVNFAINIDKYDRTKKRHIDGILDYVNYYTKERIVEYINDKLEEYKELNDSTNFNEIVLHNIKLKEKDITKYCKTKDREDLVQMIYGFENYFYNVLENTEVISYNYYNHEELFTKLSIDQLNQFIKLYNNEANINDIDEFIQIIEYRNFYYLCNENLFNNMDENDFYIGLLALEKYHKRHTNINKSLRGLNEYINKMDNKYQKKILEWGLALYPELYGEMMLEDIISNDINYQYGQVKDLLNELERNDLLKYAYNIHTYQNDIKTIYNDNIYNLFRYDDKQLYDLIIEDTHLNENLKNLEVFLEYGALHKNILNIYLENIERNQLEIFSKIIIDLFVDEMENKLETYQRSSYEYTLIEKMMSFETSRLLSLTLDLIDQYTIQETSTFFEIYEKYYYTKDNLGFYNNIMDFFRSTDIHYLKLWLRKYEMIIRKQGSNTNIQGGLKYNFMNGDEYNKKKLLEIFDIYLYRNPELFLPAKFIEIVGLDNGITPHKKLVELFENLNDANKELIMKISYSITGHFQRKNIQTSFDIEAFFKEFNATLYSNSQKYKYYIFQLFRIINIFPELNNYKLFEIMCINNETRIINLYENDYLQSIYKRDKVTIAKNIQYFYNQTVSSDERNIDKMDEEELKDYILKFTIDYNGKNDLITHVFDGNFYLLFFDFYQNYLNNIDKEHINFIFNNLKMICSEINYHCINESNATTIEDKKREIIEDINNTKEFKDPNFFDKYLDYIDGMDEDELYKALINLSTKDLKLYTLMSNIIKIETYEKNNTINYDDVPDDIYFNIQFMSRNAMIRYILKVRNINKDQISKDILPILIKQNMLDIGSDNIYDLTLY